MHSSVWPYLTVAIGGAAGAVARFAVTGWLHRADYSIPLGTLTSNLLGCFVMGIVAQLVASSSWFNDAGLFPDHYRLLFAVGFCGSFTTLSALVFEMNEMMLRGQLLITFAYLMASIAGGFAFFWFGAMLVRALGNAQ